MDEFLFELKAQEITILRDIVEKVHYFYIASIIWHLIVDQDQTTQTIDTKMCKAIFT